MTAVDFEGIKKGYYQRVGENGPPITLNTIASEVCVSVCL